MRAVPWRVRVIIDNAVLALLCAALATTQRPEWLWWPVNTAAFLWGACALSVFIVVTSGLLAIAGEDE